MDLDNFKQLLNDVLTQKGPDPALNLLIKSVDSHLELFQNLHSLQASVIQNEKLFLLNQQEVEKYKMERNRIDAALRNIIGELTAADLIDETWEFNPVETVKEQPNSVFITTPIASLSENEYPRIKGVVKELIKVLRSEPLLIISIYYPGEDIEETADFQTPEVAIKQDLQGICSSEYFIMIYPGPYLSSALVQAGFALTLHKKCLFFVNNRSTLPFILRTADKVFKHVHIVEFENLDQVPGLLKTHGLPEHE